MSLVLIPKDKKSFFSVIATAYFSDSADRFLHTALGQTSCKFSIANTNTNENTNISTLQYTYNFPVSFKCNPNKFSTTTAYGLKKHNKGSLQ